jgi:hypothetical protein
MGSWLLCRRATRGCSAAVTLAPTAPRSCSSLSPPWLSRRRHRNAFRQHHGHCIVVAAPMLRCARRDHAAPPRRAQRDHDAPPRCHHAALPRRDHATSRSTLATATLHRCTPPPPSPPAAWSSGTAPTVTTSTRSSRPRTRPTPTCPRSRRPWRRRRCPASCAATTRCVRPPAWDGGTVASPLDGT